MGSRYINYVKIRVPSNFQTPNNKASLRFRVLTEGGAEQLELLRV